MSPRPKRVVVMPPAAADVLFALHVECLTCGEPTYTGIVMSGSATTNVKENRVTCPAGHKHAYTFTVRLRGEGE